MKPVPSTHHARHELIIDAAKISWGVRLQKGADPARAAKDSLTSGALFADEVELYFTDEKSVTKGSGRKG